jgi:hypothetical protein
MNKQEKLEEAAIRLYPDNIIKLSYKTSYNAALLKRKDFIDGGNWMKKRMYSEEEVLEILFKSHNAENTSIVANTIMKWFKQFKKKSNGKKRNENEKNINV